MSEEKIHKIKPLSKAEMARLPLKFKPLTDVGDWIRDQKIMFPLEQGVNIDLWSALSFEFEQQMRERLRLENKDIRKRRRIKKFEDLQSTRTPDYTNGDMTI